MNLKPLRSPAAVAKAYQILRQEMVMDGKRVDVNVGWPSGNMDHSVYWHVRQGFWSMLTKNAQKRYWCGYGVDRPQPNGHVEFTVQINPSVHPTSRRNAGSFLQDADGRVYLCHNGTLTRGYGSKGKEFLLFSRSKKAVVHWPSGKREDVIVVSRLDDLRLIGNIAAFVKEVHTFKHSDTLAPQRMLEEVSYNPETDGTSTVVIPSPVTRERIHGAVVDALRDVISGFGKVGNSSAIDLFLVRGTCVSHIFEVKTSTQTTALYTGVGQLMLHGALPRDTPIRVLVVPGSVSDETRARLQRLSIHVLQYKWIKRRPVFDSLVALALRASSHAAG